MPTRGRIPPFLVLFVVAFVFVGLVGYQIVKERRIASANISDKEFRLEAVSMELQEQMKAAHEREKERDTAQTRLLELERGSKSAEEALVQKDGELLNMKSEYDRTVEELSMLTKVVKQKDEEIDRIRKQLQEHSSEKAKESAEQSNNNVLESSQEKIQAEEHKPADEAGIGDRTGLHEEEEGGTDGHLSATEKEMDERSKPKQDVLNEGEMKNLGEAMDKEADINTEDFSKPGELHEEEAEDQDNANIRDVDEKEIDASQDVDLHEVTQLESDLQTGNHEDADA